MWPLEDRMLTQRTQTRSKNDRFIAFILILQNKSTDRQSLVSQIRSMSSTTIIDWGRNFQFSKRAQVNHDRYPILHSPFQVLARKTFQSIRPPDPVLITTCVCLKRTAFRSRTAIASWKAVAKTKRPSVLFSICIA